MKAHKKQIAFMQLYEPVHDRFERFCRARVYGEMECGDIMNETLMVAFEKFDDLKEKKAFLSFLFGIAIRILSNQKKKKRTVTGIEQSKNTPSNDRTDHLTDVGILHEALAQLPDNQKESLILFEISGFSIAEIAQIHKVRVSAVKQRLRRGRIQLRNLLREEKTEENIKKSVHG